MKKAFTLVEIMIVMAIVGIIALSILASMKYFKTSMETSNIRTELLKNSQMAMGYLTKDIGYAVRIDNSFFSLQGLSYANSNSSISVQVPAVDELNYPVLDNGTTTVEVGYYSDYIYFYLDSSDRKLKKKMFVNTKNGSYIYPSGMGTNPYNSARFGDDGQTLVIAENVDSIVFTDFTGGTHPQKTLGEIMDPSFNPAPYTLNDYIQSIRKIGITITFLKTAPNSKDVIKTLTTQVYALRNKPKS